MLGECEPLYKIVKINCWLGKHIEKKLLLFPWKETCWVLQWTEKNASSLSRIFQCSNKSMYFHRAFSSIKYCVMLRRKDFGDIPNWSPIPSLREVTNLLCPQIPLLTNSNIIIQYNNSFGVVKIKLVSLKSLESARKPKVSFVPMPPVLVITISC